MSAFFLTTFPLFFALLRRVGSFSMLIVQRVGICFSAHVLPVGTRTAPCFPQGSDLSLALQIIGEILFSLPSGYPPPFSRPESFSSRDALGLHLNRPAVIEATLRRHRPPGNLNGVRFVLHMTALSCFFFCGKFLIRIDKACESPPL